MRENLNSPTIGSVGCLSAKYNSSVGQFDVTPSFTSVKIQFWRHVNRFKRIDFIHFRKLWEKNYPSCVNPCGTQKNLILQSKYLSYLASLLPDQNIYSSDKISLSHIDTYDGFYESSTQSAIEKILFSMCFKNLFSLCICSKTYDLIHSLTNRNFIWYDPTTCIILPEKPCTCNMICWDNYYATITCFLTNLMFLSEWHSNGNLHFIFKYHQTTTQITWIQDMFILELKKLILNGKPI